MITPRQAVQSSQNFFRTLGRIIVINWQVSPWLYCLQLILTIIQGLLPLLSAYLTAQILNSIAALLTHHSQSLTTPFVLLAGLGVVNFIIGQLSFLSFYLDDLFSMRFDLQIQKNLFEKIHQLDQSYYEDQTFNNNLNKINQNLYSLRGLNRNFLLAGGSFVQLVSTAIALIAFDPRIALGLTAAMIPVLIVEVKTSMERWRSWDKRGNDWRLQWYIRGLLTNVNDLREIKLYELKSYLMERWSQHFHAGRSAQLTIERRAQRLRAITGALDIAVSLGAQAWLLVRVVNRGLGLDSFIFYRQVIENYTNAGASLVRNLHSMQENSLYVNDYFTMMALQPRLVMSAQPELLPHSKPPLIEFKNVSFHYPEREQMVLKNISLTIKPGEDIAIVGANGAGKTTLIKLLLRMYDPTEGYILINGHDLKDIDLATWYRNIGALFQDFNRYSSLSVRDNIVMGRADLPEDTTALMAAANKSGADDFVSTYSKQYDQILNRSFENGMEPSGGQWQRIALARAFYRNANVLILDEPTSAIDAKGEFEIFERIAATQEHKTTIIISHRFSTVRNAHKIIVLEHGTIIESGSHDELRALKGRYQELFELQASGYR